jgi:N-formylglutamate amidohydrolase
MPSRGTAEHRDPGERRADIVVSDCSQKSSDPAFVDLVIKSYVRAGFKVGYNWPYLGGRVSEQYGKPQQGQHCVQVEMNRSLYMNEETKQYLPEAAEKVKNKLNVALDLVFAEVSKLG